MIAGGLSDALRRLDVLLARVCDAEEARAKRLYTVEKGWDSLRASLLPAAGLLAFDSAVPEAPLAPPGTMPALTRLVDAIGLAAIEADALVVLIAPVLEPRYGKLYAVLQDDPSTSLVTERLLFTVLGRTPARATALACALATDGRLTAPGLVRSSAGTFAARGRPVELASDVRDALLGLPRPARISGLEVEWRAGSDSPLSAPVQVVWGAGERDGVSAAIAGPDLLRAHLEQAPDPDALDALWRGAVLHAATLVIDVAPLGPDEGARVASALQRIVRRLGGAAVIQSAAPLPLPVVHHRAPAPGFAERRAAWAAAAAERGVTLADSELDRLAANHAATRDQLAAIFGAVTEPTAGELNQAAHRLRRIELRHGRQVAGGRTFDQLVLRASTRDAIERLIYFVSARDRVGETRDLEARFRFQRGPVVLFAGRSGTGKTLAAEVVAGAVGRPLVVVDLARLVSKYIGETEKHIDDILRAGERSGAVLFFDEADALFSARTEVSSSNDRYANLEVGYLLQRIEDHDGLIILATNLQHSIDEAFLRRFHARIEFPFPDGGERRQIWQLMLGDAADIDLDRVSRYRLAGGDIRNAALKAIFLAEREETALAQRHVERAVALELHELGRLSRFEEGAVDAGRLMRELLEGLESRLEDALRERFLKEVHFIHGAPTKEAIAGKRPAVSLALYRLAPTGDRGGLRLGVIVSAWSNRPEEEVELLGVLLELLGAPCESRAGGRPVKLFLQKSFDFDLLHRFWSSHGHPVRPSLVIDVELGAP